jgi:hypothetical protein
MIEVLMYLGQTQFILLIWCTNKSIFFPRLYGAAIILNSCVKMTFALVFMKLSVQMSLAFVKFSFFPPLHIVLISWPIQPSLFTLHTIITMLKWLYDIQKLVRISLWIFKYINPNKMHKSQSLFYLTTALHVLGITIAHLQEHKTIVTTASGNHYTVIDRVKFTDKEYR